MQAIRDLLSSKKFITALVAVAVAIGARYGLKLDPELVAALLGVFGILIHAQGQADHGKEAAQINADSAGQLATLAVLDSKLKITPVPSGQTEPPAP